jgi:sugar lactone lactonase YvrE
MATKKKLLQAAAGGAGSVAWDLDYAYLAPQSQIDGPLSAKVGTTSEPFDLGSMPSFSIGSSSPEGLDWSPDGTKLYMAESNGKDIREYTTTVPYSVTNTFFSLNYTLAVDVPAMGNITQPQSVRMKPDGTMMFIAWGSGVYAYDLSTAWDLSTASYASSKNWSGNANGLFFKPDGTKMYICTSSSELREFSLSTAWDPSTASQNVYVSISSDESSTEDLCFTNDGKYMIVIGRGHDEFNQYQLSTPWDISTKSLDKTVAVGNMTAPRAIALSYDNLFMWASGSNTDTIYNYRTCGYHNTTYTQPEALRIADNGTKLYVIDGQAADYILQYSLSTAYDLSTISYVRNFSINAQQANPLGLYFKSDGTQFFICGNSGDDIDTYDLSTAWDISTASYTRTGDPNAGITPSGLYFKPDGTRVFLCDSAAPTVYQRDISTAWTVTTGNMSAPASGGTFSIPQINGGNVGARDIAFKADGTIMYLSDAGAGDAIHAYDLATAWDITTATYSKSFEPAVYDGEYFTDGGFHALDFSPDGDKFYYGGKNSNSIFQYNIDEDQEYAY